ncbi:MAG: DUF502 domain-containing protein [Methanocellales archaeon]|nr:DUF502 domain-containing protein [Methanocellales archaeon]MDD3291774.1 DUF502 domain-containing protein [Methanocellales archaeon]MDD5235124.1 DUF502 domain-containing protein [Methanocellales archaeon]MDD5485262.1 DUF502 domain-containing protein [Methanocellales archaeon]
MEWRMFVRLRNYFIAGLVVLVPLLATLYIVWFLFDFLDSLLRPFVTRIFGYSITGLSFLIMLLLVLLVGSIVSHAIGKKWVELFESTLSKIPLIRVIHSSIKQASSALLMQKEEFKRVVLVEYPRKGAYVIGFVAGGSAEEIQEKTAEHTLNIFIPTAPNPTSGFLAMIPEKEVVYLDMSIEDGFKMIITGGLVTPTSKIEKDIQ